MVSTIYSLNKIEPETCGNFIASPISIYHNPMENSLCPLDCGAGGERVYFKYSSEQCNNNQIKSAQHMVYVVVVFFSFILTLWECECFSLSLLFFILFSCFRVMSSRCLRTHFQFCYKTIRSWGKIPSCFKSLSPFLCIFCGGMSCVNHRETVDPTSYQINNK